jgi:hypothetical protein
MTSWRADQIEYREYDGTFIHAECRGTARAVQRVTAPALFPGVLYVFRRPVVSLDGTKEELVVVGPSSIWVTSSSIAGEQLRPHVGTFTIASTPVRRGSSGSISLQIHQDQLAHFVGLRTAPPKWAESGTEEILEIKIDVVWPKEEEGPSAVVFVSQLTPLAVRLLDLSPRASK